MTRSIIISYDTSSIISTSRDLRNELFEMFKVFSLSVKEGPIVIYNYL